MPQEQVLRERHIEDQAVTLPIFRHHRQPPSQPRVYIGAGDVLGTKLNPTGFDRQKPRERGDQLTLSVARERMKEIKP